LAPALPPNRSPRFEIVRSIVVDLASLGGAGLITYGTWLTYRPAGWIVAGVLLFAAGVNGARR
jgi:hypothetical protein